MKLRLIRHTFVTFICVLAFAANVAYAQGSQAGSAQSTNNDNNGQTTAGAQTQLGTVRTSFWEPMGGFDIDSHSTGYAWVGPQWQRPIRDNLAFTFRPTINYLFYEFEDGPGMTEVNGPGFNVQAGLKVGGRNWFKVAAARAGSGATVNSNRSTDPKSIRAANGGLAPTLAAMSIWCRQAVRTSWGRPITRPTTTSSGAG